jgi:hypothetical protein
LTLRDGAPGIATANGAALVMENCTVTGCTETGLRVTGGTAALTDCAITSNNGTTIYDAGGGIYVGGTVTLTRCQVLNNSVTSANGGGIYIYRGVLTATDTTIGFNTAPGGGGIGMEEGTLQLTRCLVTNNVADSHEGGGGLLCTTGIFGDMAVTLKDSTFAANRSSAGQGGGIFAAAEDDSGVSALNAEGCTFSNNAAEYSHPGFLVGGGAMHLTGEISAKRTTRPQNPAEAA